MEIRETLTEEEFNARVQTAGDILEQGINLWREVWERVLQDQDIIDEGLLPQNLALRTETTPRLLGQLFKAFYPEDGMAVTVFVGTEQEVRRIEHIVREHGATLREQS